MGTGLDIGTSFIIKAVETEDGIHYAEFRDAFYRMKPATPIAGKVMEKGLSNMAYFKDEDGSFVVVGLDAIHKAIERRQSALRPLRRGVINPKEPEARRVLKFILSELVGKPAQEGETLVYSIPAEPMDQDDEEFNTGYHEDVLRKDLGELGWDAQPLNEAEAICYSELEHDDYTGICMSFGAGMVNICVMSSGEPVIRFSLTRCLAKDYLISTHRGLVPISKVKSGDMCIDNLGKYVEVNRVINNGPRAELTKVRVEGYSEDLKMTSDHRVWVKVSGSPNWVWKHAIDLEPGDKMGVPIIKNIDRKSNFYFGMNNGSKIELPASRLLGEFFGRFLGDGSLMLRDQHGRIQIAFDAKKQEAEQFKTVIQTLFGKEPNITNEDNCDRLMFHSKKIATKIKKFCYNNIGEKHFSVPVNRISHQMALGICKGLFESDGWKYKDKMYFENTSSSVALLLQNLLARFGIRTSFSIREPRVGGVNSKGVQIIGRKPIYRVEVGHRIDNIIWSNLLDMDSNCNLPITPLDYIERTIKEVTQFPYGDDTYDLEIASETGCFSSPGGVVHNSGDWIDRMAAQSTGQEDSVIQIEKENGDFTVGEEADSAILSAVSAYYVRLVDYTVGNLAIRLRNSSDLPKFIDPIPVIISGGTSRAKGFVQAFQARMSAEDFPIKIKEVRQAKDPLRAVARGCLLAALL